MGWPGLTLADLDWSRQDRTAPHRTVLDRERMDQKVSKKSCHGLFAPSEKWKVSSGL
jgi:hypothetical protein